MKLEQIQIALFAAYDMRNSMTNAIRERPTDNENFGESIAQIIEILEQLELQETEA